ncbi:uncharacterized protein SPSK_09973 [Sporothrix schenckii 1099-18]|uniref:Uncharacterized protein n=1 Tax=Sporothrix schenckii 1099-18 TaxID=1397361 RepID=A0A0F2M8P1_SPOSC|nr:uncharacterized protein SPSK_09973 [Sporothrix schenckii 1099-18]KJR85997.1 hypothetical protein SPSK_09973 [Sporothrix schenckii 1099-18]
MNDAKSLHQTCSSRGSLSRWQDGDAKVDEVPPVAFVKTRQGTSKLLKSQSSSTVNYDSMRHPKYVTAGVVKRGHIKQPRACWAEGHKGTKEET